MHTVRRQNVDLRHVVLKGRILDIGGGSEGIIGHMKRNKVVAIDPSERELREARSGGLKIIMDVRMLKFLDNTFDTVTAFFSLMYIPEDDREQVFKEVYRVLKKGGHFVIWDAVMPKRRANQKKNIFVVPLTIIIPRTKIQTTFSAQWHQSGQNRRSFQKLGEKIGFSVIKISERKSVCFMRMVKTNCDRPDQ
ncbi:class I SAM-dependent methyltransferase [candidate division WOR-3 bacterium]|nr:class I SAM-dependent methyltransferase [candidate division WOR-3 bacterium]